MTRLSYQMPVDSDTNKLQLAYKDVDALYEYNASGALEYVGKACPGAASASAVWQIKKLLYDSNYRMSGVGWASSSIDFTFVWDDKTGYTYSRL